jgi:hypothetical protein
MTVQERNSAMSTLGIDPREPRWPLQQDGPRQISTAANVVPRTIAGGRGRGDWTAGSTRRHISESAAKRDAEGGPVGEVSPKRTRFVSVESVSESEESDE